MPRPPARNDAPARPAAARGRKVEEPDADLPFWRRKTLEELSKAEWESLCDGCGRCCLVKLEDEDTGRIYFTDVACKLLDAGSCRCADYPNRQSKVPDCIRLTPETARSLSWLPPSCAYRLVAAGRDLYWWHPLVSGSPDSVHAAGVSVRGRVAALETEVALDDYPDHIVSWPGRRPAGSRQSAPGRRKKPGGADAA